MQRTNSNQYDKHLMNTLCLHEALLRATNTTDNKYNIQHTTQIHTQHIQIQHKYNILRCPGQFHEDRKPPETFKVICSGWTGSVHGKDVKGTWFVEKLPEGDGISAD